MKRVPRLRKKLSSLQRPPQSRTLEEELRPEIAAGKVKVERTGEIRGDAADLWLRAHGIGRRRQYQPPKGAS